MSGREKKLPHCRVSEKQDNTTSDVRKKKFRAQQGRISAREKKISLRHSRVSAHEKNLQQGKCARKKFAAGVP